MNEPTWEEDWKELLEKYPEMVHTGVPENDTLAVWSDGIIRLIEGKISKEKLSD